MDDPIPDCHRKYPSQSGLYEGSDPSQIALTFDDGPNDHYTLELVDLLQEYSVRATFFMVGKYVRQRHSIVRAVQQAGHVIGNHTEHHRNLSALFTAFQISNELEQCQKAIEDATGSRPTLMRPPYGRCCGRVEAAAAQLDLRTIIWSVIPKDGSADITVDLIVSRVQKAIDSRRQGEIVLLHDGDGDKGIGADRNATVDAVRRLLQHYTKAGKRFVTLSEFVA